jgi:hypothetical protein
MPVCIALPHRLSPARAPRRAAVFALAALLGLGLAGLRTAHADVKSALPPTVGNFKLTKPVATFTPTNLYNHLDGEAEAFQQYDFRQSAYGEYAPNGRGTQLITVDVFQMSSPLNAYGYYTSQRNAHARFLKIGAEGYQEPSALNFWKGPYYVRIAITASNAPLAFQQEMPKLAQAVASRLTGPTATPSIVRLLPPGYTARTEHYVRGNIAAQSYIGNGMVARYPAAGPQAELFVAVFPNPAAARQAFTRYQAYLTKPTTLAIGAKPTPIKGLGEQALAVRTKFTGEVVAAVKGKYLIGMTKAKDANRARILVQAAAARAR